MFPVFVLNFNQGPMNKSDFNEALEHNLEGETSKKVWVSPEKSDLSAKHLTKYYFPTQNMTFWLFSERIHHIVL